MSKRNLLLLLISLIVYTGLQAQNSIAEKLKSFSQLQVTKIPTMTGYNESYLIMMKQPIEHSDTTVGFFEQRIWLNHLNNDAPMVMVTEGYSADRNYVTELAKELHANQIIVEHRYFHESTPANKDWKYLTVKNSAYDHHDIIELFKNIYHKKWLTTGISKGGQTTLFHRAFFPKDVDVSVPYVAPINFEREDPRLLEFFKTVSTAEDRAKIKEFQFTIMQKKAELMPMFIEYCKTKGMTFSMGFEKAYEMAILEYPFAFWQWGVPVSEIPRKDATNKEILNHFMKGADPGYLTDKSMKEFEPFFYQAYKELGYYNYVPGELKPLMSEIKQDTISNCIFAPGGDTLQFNRNTMQYVAERLKKYNPKMILICGENDPWGSTSLNVTSMSRSHKFVKPKGCHKSRINNIPEEQKEEAWKYLKKWMKVK